MSEQSHRPNQTRGNKASEKDKAARQKQQPTSQGAANQTQTIQPDVLQQALKNPQAARRDTILQLQRLYGNRAVGQLIARLGADRANAPNGSQPALGALPAVIQARLTHELPPTIQQTGSIQRLINFEFKAEVGLMAGALKAHDQMFQSIIKTFKKYKKASKRNEISEEYRLLKKLKELCKGWLDTYADKYPNTNKTTDLQNLLPKINDELAKPQFLPAIKVDPIQEQIMDIFIEYREAKEKKWISAEYELLKELRDLYEAWIIQYGGDRANPKLTEMISKLAQTNTDLMDPNFAEQAKSARQMEKIKAYQYKTAAPHDIDKLYQARKNKSWLLVPPAEQKEQKERQKKRVADLKKLNLTRAERSAIASYTNENFTFINPAISGDKKWLEASLSTENEKRQHVGIGLLDTSPQGIDKAVAENKKIAKLAQAGLDKLPNWKQDHLLYRGDTFSKEEGQNLTAGNKKTYPHFVSTSLGTIVPRNYAHGKRRVERPIGIVWHITQSKNGKDVASLSVNEGEQEILFPPNTTFQIDKVINETADDRGIIRELEVREV